MFLRKRKREVDFGFLEAYFLLSNRASTTPTIAIAAIIPPVAGSKYWSAKDTGAGVGACVGSGAGLTANAVSANEE
jgi:hypothetical protein